MSLGVVGRIVALERRVDQKLVTITNRVTAAIVQLRTRMNRAESDIAALKQAVRDLQNGP